MLVVLATLSAKAMAAKHEKGRCAMYSTCGKQGFFGQELPCPDNEEARKVGERVLLSQDPY